MTSGRCLIKSCTHGRAYAPTRGVIEQSNCRWTALCHVKNYRTPGNFKSLSNIPYGCRARPPNWSCRSFLHAVHRIERVPAFLLAPRDVCFELEISIIHFLIEADEFFTCSLLHRAGLNTCNDHKPVVVLPTLSYVSLFQSQPLTRLGICNQSNRPVHLQL